jgi:guanosine-3',5'-bis(diphosphate) 3'-pyrophosphohydrolase
MTYFSNLKKELVKYLDKKQIARVQAAYTIAEKAHENQKRQSGEAYITHPVAVAETLAHLRLDPDTLIAAIMHDTLEDTGLTKPEITEQFGISVADLVDGVSKLTHITFANRAEAQAENFRRMILAMAKDVRVILIKLADRLHNMQTLNVVSAEKRRRIARETLEIYIPLANRLGMHKLGVQLEELCFAALYPERERVLKESVRKIRGNRKEIIHAIEKALTEVCKHKGLINFEITGREKHLFSIFRKMRARQLSLTDIMDVYAFRILVDSVEDCYRVLGYVHNLYKPVPERFKDFIAIPKANGYQSLHTTLFGPYGVPIEIQIRTREMHALAENGIAAHWLYKSEKPYINVEAQLRTQAWLKNLIELHKSSSSPAEFIETVKTDLFPDEVYVFTPKGDIMSLPQGATVLDFAYAVHSDIGDRCVAGKIDRHYVLLSTPLTNGQTVEVITAPNARPNPAWLDFAKTGKAQSLIRHYFKRQRNSELIDLGRNLFEHALADIGLQYETVPPNIIDEILKTSNLQTYNQLLEMIGAGQLTAQVIVHRITTMMKDSSTSPKTYQPSEVIPIRGTEGVELTLAKCCYPIPGDPIVGHLTEHGLMVHAEPCPQAEQFRHDPQHAISLRWDNMVEKDFVVPIEIELPNKRGILNEITSTINHAGCNIEDIYFTQANSIERTLTILLMVKNFAHLEKVITRLEHITSISKVTRLRSALYD